MHFARNILVVVLYALISTVVPAAAFGATLSLWHKFDETSGTVAADSSGNANNGTYTGGPTLGAVAPRYLGVYFGANGQYVTAPASTTLNALGASNADFSVAFWVKPNGTTGDWRAMLHKGSTASERGPGLWLNPANNRIHFRVGTTANSNEGSDSVANLPNGTWSHIACVKAGNKWRCYVNGVLDREVTLSAGTTGNNGPLYVGDDPWYSGSQAWIDDVRLYNGALTNAEVKNLYDGLVGHWKLDEASGTTAADSSGNNNNGTHTNGPVLAQAGVRSNAVQFDGTNDYTTAGSSSSLTVIESVTMSAWVNPTASANAVRMIVNKEGEYELGLTSAGVVQWALANTTPGWAWHTTGATVPNGKWSNIVVTYDSGTAKTYVDGVLKETFSGAGNIGDANIPLNELRIAGRSNNPANQYLGGLVDDVRVYNRAILAKEVAELYGLVGHWKFDEAAGTVAADSSGMDNNATINGAAAWTSDCAGNTALDFDGINDRARTNSNFQPPATGAVAFWMRGSGAPAVQQRLFGINGNWEARLAPTGIISFDLGASPFVGNEPFATPVVDELDRWYHVVAVFNDSTDAYSVYINGELTASGISPVNLIARSAGILSIGTTTGSTEYWKGALRDFRIYNRAMFASEIASFAGMIARWQLNESSGTVATDASVAGNNATYVGSPTLGVVGSNTATNGTAVELNGTSQSISSSASLLNGLAKFSLATWIRPDSLTPDKSFLGQNGVIELGIDASANQIDLWTSGGGSISATSQLALSKWSHVVAVGDGTGLKIYVNGVEVSSGGSATASYGSNSSTFKIGEGVLAPSGDYFDGRFDDVRVYSRAMCPEEINSIYQGGRPAGVRIIRWIETR